MRTALASRRRLARVSDSALPECRSDGRYVPITITFGSCVDEATWRRSWRLALSAQWRSSRIRRRPLSADTSESRFTTAAKSRKRSASGSGFSVPGARQALRKRGHHGRERRPAVADVLDQEGVLGVDDEVRQGLGEGLIAHHEVFVATSVEDRYAELEGLPCHLLAQ